MRLGLGRGYNCFYSIGVIARSDYSMTKWLVTGGIFKDLGDEKPMAGTEETYGPFDSEKEADKVWRAHATAKIDICNHRLRVIKVD